MVFRTFRARARAQGIPAARQRIAAAVGDGALVDIGATGFGRAAEPGRAILTAPPAARHIAAGYAGAAVAVVGGAFVDVFAGLPVGGVSGRTTATERR